MDQLGARTAIARAAVETRARAIDDIDLSLARLLSGTGFIAALPGAVALVSLFLATS